MEESPPIFEGGLGMLSLFVIRLITITAEGKENMREQNTTNRKRETLALQ
jgi:hypothetical protein